MILLFRKMRFYIEPIEKNMIIYQENGLGNMQCNLVGRFLISYGINSIGNFSTFSFLFVFLFFHFYLFFCFFIFICFSFFKFLFVFMFFNFYLFFCFSIFICFFFFIKPSNAFVSTLFLGSR